MKRNNLMNLCLLLLIVFSLFLLDKTKLNKYIGYKKVKQFLIVDYNFYPLANKVFGSVIHGFYQDDISVNNNIISEHFVDGYNLVYQSEELLYSTYVGSVFDINKRNDFYDVYINLGSGQLAIYNLKYTDLDLYQKIEANMIIGYLPYSKEGYYYYYQKY